MSIQRLPFEVLLHIFQNLNTTSLVHCVTVCKAWNTLSTQVIYESIELSNSPTRKLAFYENQDAGVNVGTLARSLKIGIGFNPFNQERFLKLLSYMPYLKVIELSSVVYSSFSYLVHLSKREDHCIQYLEYLDFDCILGSRKEMQTYFLLAYSLRHTLKNLYLFNLGNIYTVGGTSNEKSAVEFFNDFPHLTRLTIDNRHGESNPQLSIVHIIRSCPNLTSFYFRRKHSLLAEDEKTSISDGNHSGIIVEATSCSSSKIITVANPKLIKLQDFVLRSPSMTQPQLQRILSSLPATTTMNSFKLKLDDTPWEMWIQELQKTTLEHLRRCLGNVRQKSKISIFCCEKRISLINKIPSSIEITAKFFSLIGAIMKYRKPPYCHLQIHISNQVLAYRHVKIKKNDRCLFFSYELDYADYETRILSRTSTSSCTDTSSE